MGRRWFGLVAVLLAGCVSSPGASFFVPAKDPLVRARAAALAWQEDPVLVRVHGIEPGHALEGLGVLAGRPDPRLGDGKVQAWEYLFRHDADFYAVVMAADGAVLSHGTTTPPAVDGFGTILSSPLSWNLDSDEVVHVLRRHVPDWDSTAAEARIVHWYLSRTSSSEAAHWIVGLEGPGADRSFLVNSMNGSFLPFELSGVPASELPTWEGGSRSILLSPQTSSVRIGFELASDRHPSLVVGSRIERAATGSVNVTLKYGGMALASFGWETGAAAGARRSEAVAPANGTYEVDIRLEGLAPQSLEVFWCAKGLPPTTMAQHPCRL